MKKIILKKISRQQKSIIITHHAKIGDPGEIFGRIYLCIYKIYKNT